MALIVFDIDGTLFRADLVTTPAVQQTFAAFGLPLPEAETIHSYFGRPWQAYHAWMASLCPAERVQALIEATDRREIELITEAGLLYPGVHEMLSALRSDGHVLATCSNGPDDYVNAFLDGHDVRRHFVLTKNRGHRDTNKSAMLGEILAELSVRPAIVVGDRNDDILAARENGAQSIGARYGFGAEDELENADAWVDAVREIPERVSMLLRCSSGCVAGT